MDDAGNRAEAVKVAPRAGAWIETHNKTLKRNLPVSPPVRGRGLKPFPPCRLPKSRVAPRAGAWIETVASLQICRLG